ncbi:tetratricopeptide repeat protein [bacterium]|nr:tetratricopeptide repeat protein [bacterium]
MLDQQFFGDKTYHPYLNENFIVVHAVRGETEGDSLYTLFEIRATPTVLITTAAGEEIDRLVGFGDPEDFLANLKASWQGEDTFLKLQERYAEHPEDLITAFKLAGKYDAMYNPEKSALAVAMYEGILEQAEKARTLSVPYGTDGEEINLYENTVYALGAAKMYLDRSRDAAPGDLMAFVKAFPDSRLAKSAYQRLCGYFAYSAPVDEAREFFDTLLKTYPEDPSMLYYYVNFCIRQQVDIDRGIEAAEKMVDSNSRMIYYHMNAYARLLALKEDADLLAKEYGDDYIQGKITNLGRDISSYASFWLQRNENLESVMHALNIAIATDPGNARFLPLLAETYVKMDSLEKALELYGEEFLYDNIEDARTLYSYALFWTRQGQNLENALFAAERAVQLSDQYYYWNALGQVHRKMGNYQEAIQAVGKAVELNPLPYYQQQLEEIRKEMAELH